MMTRFSCHGWWSMPDVSCPGVKKVVTGRHHRHMNSFVPFGEKVLARKISTDPIGDTRFGIWLGMRNNSAECFIGNADGVFRAREIRRLEPQDRWDAEALNNVISSGLYSNPSVAVRGCTGTEGENHQARHPRVRSHDWMPRLQCNLGQQKSASILRSLQESNRRASQNHST